jgi:hypothetical protein
MTHAFETSLQLCGIFLTRGLRESIPALNGSTVCTEQMERSITNWEHGMKFPFIFT